MPWSKLCIVCGLHKDEVRRLYCFPRNANRAATWKTSMGMKFAPVSGRICDKHFTEQCFANLVTMNLTRVAIPTLLPAVQQEEPAAVEDQAPPLLMSKTPVDDIEPQPGCSKYLDPQPQPLSSAAEPQTSCSVVPATSPVHLEALPPSPERSSRTRGHTLKSRSLFRNIPGLSKADLTPRKKALINIAKKKDDHLRQLKKICKERGNTIKNYSDIDSSPVIQKILQGMSSQTVNLMLSQIRCSKRLPKGRRWTLDEKVIALALLKRSPRCYALLRKFLTLPSRRTLTSLLEKIPFSTGINEHLFQHLGQCLKKRSPEDRVCSLSFDEMGIRENISYDRALDRIVGFEDLGSHGGSSVPANHALVLMAQGVCSKWKQPVAFYFSHGGVNAEQLKLIVCEVLEAMQRHSLDVVATISDMGTANVKCANLLGANAIHPWFEFNGQLIVHIFDLPHIIKRIRSLFQKYRISLKVPVGGQEVIMEARWSHIQEAYDIDKQAPLKLRCMPKLRDAHLKPSVQQLMKVKLAVQVLSRSVAAFLYSLYSRGQQLAVEALATATFVQQVDDIFDSLNGGSAPSGPEGKELKCRASLADGSPHLSFWQKAVETVRGWKFIRPSTETRPPSHTGLIHTLRAFQKLWFSLKSRGIKFFSPRSCNQDPLENQFGGIRSSCGNNENPTVPQFVSGLKTQIINGLTNQGLQGTNCEDDGGEALSDLRTFLESTPEREENLESADVTSNVGISASGSQINSITADIVANAIDENSPAVFSVAYVAGYIAKRLPLNISCDECRKAFTSDSELPCNQFISFKEFSEQHKHLTYPSEQLVFVVGQAFTLLEDKLPTLHQASGISNLAISYIEENVDLSWISCPIHAVLFRKSILVSVIRIGIPWYCTKVNRAMKSKSDSQATQRKLKKLRHH